ncbi:NUDIX domain-containing protein [uncultured Flavobacterium sp.]|uniref:NUDIX domain-containing protein n=1 Tax=uncultured Flavobacterium sp. TaxID=165435 RepID=UPI0025DADBE8|nr:NUDIX domain-containing protein [uncultured Flavobacterium sp.]
MKMSAGILVYKKVNNEILFFLAHPGGPFWKNKDIGAWSIPKGELNSEENTFDAAIREFKEETGITPKGNFIELNPVKLKSGKKIFAWAVEDDIDADTITSNEFPFEWPPKSGKFIDIPEIDRCDWFSEKDALEKLNVAQTAFVTELLSIIEEK